MDETEKNKKSSLWNWIKDVERHSQDTILRKAASKWMQPLLMKCVSVVAIIFLGVISWRIAWANWTVDFSKFEFSDLLALIMGIFAISMSIAFYFKATDTSNKFYDNVYKFTQDTSVILGRIEAGFGERLRHLDEGYSGLQTRFDNFSPVNAEETEKKVEKNKEREADAQAKLQETIDEKQKMFDELAKKAKLQAQEKKELFSHLNMLEARSDDAEMRLRKLQKERDNMEEQMDSMGKDSIGDMGGELEQYLMHIFNNSAFRHLMLETRGAPFKVVRNNFREQLQQYPVRVIRKLRNSGVLSEDGDLTIAGYVALKALSRRFRKGEN